ncbi:MAG: hypothetical protein RMY29_020030 [Nostoc sp. CreGUA01]|nr:hypothetical protein [Nostoc sp. CreGUA01]
MGNWAWGMGQAGSVGGVSGVGGWGRNLSPHTPHTPSSPSSPSPLLSRMVGTTNQRPGTDAAESHFPC